MNIIGQALTFDDILLRPGFTNFAIEEISLKTRLAGNIELEIPLVSSPMDRVTQSEMAIAIAKLGGIGFIHRNQPASQQIKEVQKVKAENLLVGAAIGTKPGYRRLANGLVKAGADVLLIDTAHGFSCFLFETLKYLKKKWPEIPVIAGNIATAEAAVALAQAGADALRVGMGPGSICTTRIVSGMGVPQITALDEIIEALRSNSLCIPVIADGGIRYSGDIVKALAIGASTVMIGSIFASAEESPGAIKELTAEEVPSRFKSITQIKRATYRFKEYRGMGSSGAMKAGKKAKVREEFHGNDLAAKVVHVAEGVEGLVPVKGTLDKIIGELLGGILKGFNYIGAKDIPELWQKARFYQITPASLQESHAHDILITNPGKNYLA